MATPSDPPYDPADIHTITYNEKNILKIHLHGCTIISWIQDGKEKLFLSEKAVFDNKKAIRGGIPLVFPHFGPWDKGPQHGFARLQRWKFDKAENLDKTDGTRSKSWFVLEDNEDTRAMWDYKFKLTYVIHFGDNSVTCNFEVLNTDKRAFNFNFLFHTYLRVDDISKITIGQLKDLRYEDKTDDHDFSLGQLRGQKYGDDPNELPLEEREWVTIDKAYDRWYQKSSTYHDVFQNGDDRVVRQTQINMPDSVVWNPWAEKAKAMSDFGDEEYKNMVCLEPGYIWYPRRLEPTKKWYAESTLFADLNINY